MTDRYTSLTNEQLMAERLNEIRGIVERTTCLHALCLTVTEGGSQERRDHWISQARKSGATSGEIDYYSGRRLGG